MIHIPLTECEKTDKRLAMQETVGIRISLEVGISFRQ